MAETEDYTYKGYNDNQAIGFGAYKALDDASSLVKVLAWATSSDTYVITSTTTSLLGLTWSTTDAEEKVDAAINLQGVASADANIRIEVTQGETFTVIKDWLFAVEAGVVGKAFPWVLEGVPVANSRYRLRLRIDAGTLTIQPGAVSWFINRKG